MISNITVKFSSSKNEEEKAKKLRKQVFLKYMISNLLSSTISASFLNSLNVLTVRMQNIEYQHNKSIRKAIKDMIVNDKFRMFYKGIIL